LSSYTSGLSEASWLRDEGTFLPVRKDSETRDVHFVAEDLIVGCPGAGAAPVFPFSPVMLSCFFCLLRCSWLLLLYAAFVKKGRNVDA